MDYKAEQKFIVGSPKKLRAVLSMIRNLKPTEAIERLPFSSKRLSAVLIKVIKSAIANAKQKNINPDDLIFKEIVANEGPKLKRYRAGSRGRAKPYEKRMSHIRVILTTRKSQIQNPKSETISVSKTQNYKMTDKENVDNKKLVSAKKVKKIEK